MHVWFLYGVALVVFFLIAWVFYAFFSILSYQWPNITVTHFQNLSLGCFCLTFFSPWRSWDPLMTLFPILKKSLLPNIWGLLADWGFGHMTIVSQQLLLTITWWREYQSGELCLSAICVTYWHQKKKKLRKRNSALVDFWLSAGLRSAGFPVLSWLSVACSEGPSLFFFPCYSGFSHMSSDSERHGSTDVLPN